MKPNSHHAVYGCKREQLGSLILEAYQMYQIEVLEENILYQHFVDDFLNSNHHTHHQDAHGLNLHRTSLHNIGKLLKTRKDLVERYFTQRQLNPPDIHSIIQLFYTTEAPQFPFRHPSDIPIHKSRFQTFHCHFNDIQMSLITQCVNEAHFLSAPVDIEQLRNLFNGTIAYPLQSANNRLLAFFFNALSTQNLITHNWQQTIELSGMILSSGSKKPLNHNQLSSALTEARSKSKESSVYELIEIYTKQVKDNK